MRYSFPFLVVLPALLSLVACGTDPQPDDGAIDVPADAATDGSGGDVSADTGPDDINAPDADVSEPDAAPDAVNDVDDASDTGEPGDTTDISDDDAADATADAPDFSDCGELECELDVPSCNGSLLFNCEVLADGCPGLVLVEDCGSDDLVCTAVEGVSTCAAEPACDDGIFNGTETDLDCGGDCDQCRDGRQCDTAGDCISNSCVAGVCTAPSCTDGQVNGVETDVDCGGAECDPCDDDSSCAEAIDCVSGVCESGFCSPASCSDSVGNGNETGIDCGGDCPGCPAESPCLEADDCISLQCSDGVCRDPACDDGIQNQDESDTDCGGTLCATCPTDSTCGSSGDCTSSVCNEGVCVAASCGDGVVNGASEDCDGAGETATCDANCTARACGDGTVNATAGETCDTGGPSATCDADCTTATCGDGFVNLLAGEECDDRGESTACNANCTPARCGDSVVNTVRGEQCDTGGFSLTCDNDCTAPLCGDGVVNATRGESCDPGRETASCDADCTPATCGDGVINASAGETCDTGGAPTSTCTAVCQAPRCGDGILQPDRGEQCDTGGPSATCNSACQAQTLCGNGILNPGEACDTGGESTTCNADCSAVRCGDNIVNFTAGESCDGATLPTAACDVDCTPAICGDGRVNAAASELCDDGNSFFGDCCSSSCRSQQCESEPNNLTSNADVISANTTIFGRLTAGELDYFSITVPANSGIRIVTGGETIDTCTSATDTVIRLLNSASGELARDDDDADTGFCSLIAPDRDPGAYNLPAGTYYIEVDGFSGTATYEYSIRWSIVQTCGNAVIEPGETCDGGASCGTNCQRLAVCGNGFIDASEACDDGNTTAGDGCGATCALEGVVTEQEGFNDDFLLATFLGTYNVNPRLVLTGALGTTADVDYIPLNIAAEGVYRFEIANNINGSCVSPVSTPTLSLRDASDTELVASVGGGPDRCAGITVWLPAGMFYLRYGASSAVVPFYRFTAERLTARGAEVEPNELTTTATALTLPGVMTGFRGPTTDIDYYRIQITRPSSLFVEVIEGDASYNCSANLVDPRIRVLNASGTEVGIDDDGGRGFCSSANGIGSSPDETGLRLLQPGVYYIEVTNSTFSDPGTPEGDFNYRLVAFTRSPY